MPHPPTQPVPCLHAASQTRRRSVWVPQSPTSGVSCGSRAWVASLILLGFLGAFPPSLPAATQALLWSSGSGSGSTPTRVAGATFSSLAIGADAYFGLQSDGRVVFSQSGPDAVYRPPSSLTNAVSIAARLYTASALRSNGRVVNWGGLVIPTPTTLSNVVAIAQGVWQTVALRTDGTVAAWGNPEYPAGIHVPVNLEDVVAVSSGNLNSLALRADGTVAAWALVNPELAIVPEAATNVIAVAAGYEANYALRADGSVVGWGPGDTVFFPTFLSTNLVDISAGPNFLLALTGDGRVLSTGSRDLGVTNALEITPTEYTERFMVLTGDGSPHIIHQPSDSSGATGQKLRLVAKAGGNRPLGLQWTKDGALIPGATNAVLLLDHASLTDSGIYQLTATNALGSAQSRLATLNVLDEAPRIHRVAVEPQSRIAFPGGSASLSVDATGSTPIQFQWQFEGIDIPGATQASISLHDLRIDQSGDYTVVVRNPYGSVTSPPARLLVREVVGWGSNWDKAIQIPKAATNVVAIAGGTYHSVAVRSDGTVVAWGNTPTGGGQYPGGSIQPPANLSNVVAVAAGRTFNVALLSDGRLRGWGDASGFGLGLSSLSNIIAVAADYGHTLALGADGTVYAGGMNFAGQTDVPPGLTDAVDIVAAWEASTVLRSDGSIVEWGSGRKIGADSSIRDFAAIAPGVGLRADGSLFGSWLNGFQPGEIVALSASRDHSLALRRNGTVLASGDDYHGQVSVPPELRNVVAIATGFQHSLALVGGGSPRIVQQPLGFSPYIGGNARLRVSAIGELPLTYQWRQNKVDLSGATDALLALDGVSFFDGGDYEVVVSNARGSVTSSVARLTPTSRAPFDVRLHLESSTEIAFLGGSARLSAEARGTPTLVYRWQVNDRPIPEARDPILQLGPLRFEDAGNYTLAVANASGSSTSSTVRLSVVNLAAWGRRDIDSDNRVFSIPPALTNTIEVSANHEHVLARRADGTTVAWGNPASGKLAVPASATNLTSIAAGSSFSLGLRSDRTVLAWGDTGTLGIRNPPQSLSNVVQIAAGKSWALALRDDGTVVQWGFLGTTMQPPPDGLSNVVQVASGNQHALALLRDGTVLGWGLDTNIFAPLPDLTDVVDIRAGDAFSLALRADGSVVQWGAGIPSGMATPPEAFGLVAIATGGNHCLGLREDGSVVAWGFGNGSGEQIRVPTNLPPVVAIAAAADASFAVIPASQAPFFAHQPRHQERFSGQSLLLEGTLFPNSLPTTFQWLRHGSPIPGETNRTLHIPTAEVSHSGRYQLVASNADGTTFSREADVRVSDFPPRVISEPSDVHTYLGGPAEFPVVAVGSAGIRYQWLFNGTPIIGATNASLILTASRPENVGNYQLVLENRFGTQLTRTAQLQITNATYLGETQIAVDAFGRFTVRVRLSEPTSATVSFTLTYGGTRRISATVPPGQAERLITLTDLDFATRLRSGSTDSIELASTSFGIVGAPNTARLTYVPGGVEPAPPRLLISQLSEHSPKSEVAYLSVSLESPAGIAGRDVLFHTRDQSAKAGEDYQFTAGFLRFEAGQTEANSQVSIPLERIRSLKPDSSFEVVFRDISEGAEEILRVATVGLRGTLRFEADSLREGSVAKIHPADPIEGFPLRVHTVDGTAKAGLDYVAVDREWHGPDDTRMDIELLEDGFVEGPETFDLVVSRPGDSEPLATFTFAIEDDEIPLGQDESFRPHVQPLILSQSVGIMKADDSFVLFSGQDQAFWHLTPNGQLLGRLATSNPNPFQPLGMVQQPDGRLIVGFDGERTDFNPDQPALIRWTEDGKPDPSFRFDLTVRRAMPVAVQSSGRILVLTGPELEFDLSPRRDREGYIRRPSRLLRLYSDGSLDPTFRSDGRDGVPLIPRYATNPPDAGIGLFLPGPNTDANWDRGSLVFLDVDGGFLREEPIAQKAFTTLFQRPDGTRYGEYVGRGLPGSSGDRLVRQRPDGSDDPDFLTSRYDFPSPWKFLGVQADGKPVILSSGDYRTDARLIRFLVDTPKDRRRIEWDHEETIGTSTTPRAPILIGHEGTPVFLPIRRLGDTTRAEQVTLSTRDGLAVQDLDYASTNILVTLPAGDGGKYLLRMETFADPVSEGFEDFDVILNEPSPGLELGEPRLRVGLYDTTPILRLFILPRPFGNDQFLLNMGRFTGRRVVLEGSTDLNRWETVSEWIAEVNSRENFMTTPVFVHPVQPYRFLRAGGY